MLNIEKTIFHEKSAENEISGIPDLKIGSKNVEKTSSIKFLRVMLDKHLSWNDRIKTVENKLAKNIGFLNCASYFLNEHFLQTIYFSFIHSYLNYVNIAWASTYVSKLKKINLLQKRAVRFVFDENRISHSRPLLRKINALNVYQINLYQHLNFMHKFNNQETPRIFNDLIKKPVHKYPTNFSKSNICLKNVSLSSTKYSISFRGPKLSV